MKVVLLLLGLMLVVGTGACPPPEVVYPCTCSTGCTFFLIHKLHVDPVLRCGGIDAEQLGTVLKAHKLHAKGGNIMNLHLENYRGKYIPAGLLSGTDLKNLYLNTSALQSFHDPEANKSSFAGVEDALRSLTMNYYGGKIENFDWSSLSPLRNLYNLYLSGSFAAFREPLPSLPTVVNFWFKDSEASFMVDDAFAGLTGVHDFRVINNPMKTYSRTMFPRPASNLSVFITSHDGITVLPEDYFDDMPALSYVQLPYFVHNIPPLSGNGTTGIQSSHRLTCDCRLKWLLRMRDEGKVFIHHAICARPQHLRWRDVKSLKVDEL